MKISIAKKEVRLNEIIVGTVFFVITGVIFFLYSVDFSPLVVAFILVFFARHLKIAKMPSYVDLALLGALALLITILTAATFKLSAYAISAIGFTILITLLFDNLTLSLLYALFISFLGASVDGGNFSVAVSLFSGSLVGAVFSFRVRRRFQVIRAGLIAGLVQFLVAFVMEQQQNFFIGANFDFTLLRICLFNGIGSSIIVLGILPVFEYIFRVVTNISLLELSDFNHPLLKKLILEAPGTYQHSLVVANLSEAAAEVIGANSLLARVGAYYHDVGKMLKPEYFVENQLPRRDMHRDLKPSMSKLIIIKHVKEGIDLAKKYRLNPRIIDFITEHHGRSLVYYFYHRAKEQLLEGKLEEEEYRYPGPKPQSRETAICSLADAVEALSRTLEEPTPARIEEMIREIVRKKFMEGELDESNLTLKDLEKIIQEFSRILNAIFHTRINYPKHEDRDIKPTKPKENKS